MHGNETLIMYRQLLFDSCLSLYSEFTQTRLKLIHGCDNKMGLHVMAAMDQSGYFLDCEVN
jgi:hypothetical protein